MNAELKVDFPDTVHAVEWIGDAASGYLKVLDQRLLPGIETSLEARDVDAAILSIREMLVRGAPAIGCTAAYAMVLAVREAQTSQSDWRERLRGLADQIKAARPTAVNLRWAVDRVLHSLETVDSARALAATFELALRIHREDIEANLTMAELGADCLEAGAGVLTHCNTGSLATGGHGTALGVIRTAWEKDRISTVFASETRPWLQGARLTAWELNKSNIPVNLIVDSASAALMQSGQIGSVIVGADRVAANGDVANKIGTYSLALLARSHGLSFMVVAPFSTIDFEAVSGDQIPIENRPAAEVFNIAEKRVAAEGIDAWNPVFDVTPADLIDWLVTERGVIHKPNTEALAKVRSGT